MTINRSLKAFIAYGVTVFLFIGFTLFLKERNDSTFIMTLFIITVLFLGAISEWRKYLDRVFCFLFPIVLSITKTVWIAQPQNETLGILSVSAGLYVCASDIIIIYFLWRIPFFQKKRTISRKIIMSYIFFVALSVLFAYTIEFALAGLLLYLKCFIIFEWFSSYPNLCGIKKHFLAGTEVTLIFQGIVAILQKKMNGPIGLSFLGENNEALRYRIVNGVIERGAAGTFEHSSRLSIFVIFVLLIIYFNERKKYKKSLLLVWGMIILYLAASRTAILVFFIAIMYNIWKYRSRIIKRKTVYIFISVCVVAIIIAYFVTSKNMAAFITNSDISYQFFGRLNHWVLAFKYISQRGWILGYGVNNYASKMTTINASEFNFLNPVHNNYILNWFELGVLGFIAYIAIYVVFIYKAKRYKELIGFDKSATLFLLCTLIYNFTGWALAAPTCIYMLWTALGLMEREEVEA